MKKCFVEMISGLGDDFGRQIYYTEQENKHTAETLGGEA